MKRFTRALLAWAALGLAAPAVAQVTFYENEGLRGRTFAIDRAINNFDHYGFNDKASSVIVQRGQWEVCEHADFQGRCAVLRPGQYPSLSSVGMNNVISSARPIRGGPNYSYVPPPPPPAPPPYGFYPQPGETLYEANVQAVRAVMGPPEQRCWVDREYAQRNDPNVGGAIIGGILGGVLGHQIGSGRGNDVATALGAVGGAAVGANVDRNRGGYAQDVRRCQAVPGSGPPQYWDVTYEFRGRIHRAQLASPPGATITVNGRGEPRM